MKPVEQKAMSQEIIAKIRSAGVIAVLVVDDLEHAVPLAKALLDGGVDTIELTMRTPVALDAAKIIKKEFPEICLGMGTVLTTDQVKACADIGADFAVAPGCNPSVISEAYRQKLSFAPGIMTPSDIEIAVEQGCRILKYFPAESAGGLNHLKNIAGPYQYLGLSFIPLGGLNLATAEAYIDSPMVAAIGGSWLAKQPVIQAENWDEITKNAREITSLVQKIRE
ncbi:bifunctional 4-hydroxy-2-oxoglutarate aldolase/2-dehydro-3-deoxy-phosphogluconate aldolase [Bacteroidota bacterium]